MRIYSNIQNEFPGNLKQQNYMSRYKAHCPVKGACLPRDRVRYSTCAGGYSANLLALTWEIIFNVLIIYHLLVYLQK